MKISVIIPAYNAEKFVEEAVNSIINQTYTNWELLICDDCSTDSTYEIICNLEKTDERITIFKNEKNLKKPLTVQKLVQEATGDLFTFHDADDFSHLERFEKMVRHFEANPEYGMIGHVIERTDIDGKPIGMFRRKYTDQKFISKNMAQWNTEGDPSIFIKKEVIQQIKWVYRPFFTNGMDYDLALRIREQFKTTNLLETLSYYRNVPDSISKGVDGYEKFLMPEFAKEFAKQRAKKGTDLLMDKNQDEIEKLRIKLAQPYIKDKSLHLRKMADFFNYIKMNQSNFQYSKRAVKKDPFKLINWKYFINSIMKKSN